MLVVTRHRVTEGQDFLEGAARALSVLSERPGCQGAEAVRAIDDPGAFLLVTRWLDVGSYRRALSSFEVKMAAVQLLSAAEDVPSAFEVLLSAEDGQVTSFTPDLAVDADTAGPH